MAKTRGGYSRKTGKRPIELNTDTSNTTDVRRWRPILGGSSNSGVDLRLKNFPVPAEPLNPPHMSPRPTSSHTESRERIIPIFESNASDSDRVPRRARTGRVLNQGVSIPPLGANKLTIYISDGAILPGDKPPRAIGKICRNNVNGPWHQWSDVIKSVRDLMFEDFKKRFNWDRSIDAEVRERFEAKCGGLWADMMNKERKRIINLNGFTDVSHLIDQPPSWCRKEFWNDTVTTWSSEKWRKKSDTNFNNRISDNGEGVVKHVGGSICIPEHKRRITELEGQTPNPYELYKRLHQKQKDEEGNKIKDGPFIDP